MQLVYAIILLVLFYLLLVTEFLLPTGGLLGAAAVATLVAAIAIAFAHSWWLGISVTSFALLTTPIVFVAMIRYWPHTPIGRRMLNRRPDDDPIEAPTSTAADGTPLKDLVGRIGIAKSDLLPSGLVRIGNMKLDAVSTGMPIDNGTRVIVTSAEAGKIHVRAAHDDETEETPDLPQSPPSLEQPLDSFDFE